MDYLCARQTDRHNHRHTDEDDRLTHATTVDVSNDTRRFQIFKHFDGTVVK